ncbi:chemotaxis protein CheB [Paracoccaceae bacterium Fryx2]|nr:chemotaxis protein CheB [Paracoccaceae bacterium Fryx2]
MNALRMIIASPSPLERSRLAKALAGDPRMTVIAQTADLSETYTRAEQMEPDIVLLAAAYTGVAEFACMEALFDALEISWLAIGAEGAARPAVPMIAATMTPDQLLQRIAEARRLRAMPGRGRPRPARQAVPHLRRDRIVLIGASTGGVVALLTVLGSFPADCPPTAIVQHTGRGYSESLIKLLDRNCAARVVSAAEGLVLQPGSVCVAGGSAGHLRLLPGRPLRCAITPGAPVSGHMPSVDALFRSFLPVAGQVVAVVLTGMGRDGAEGLLDLRRAGAHTIGQDEASSVVYGMPRAAAEIGAVQQQLGLDRIGPEILRLCGSDSALRPVTR